MSEPETQEAPVPAGQPAAGGKKSPPKRFRKILLGIVIILVVVAVVIVAALDNILKAALEKGGTYALDAQTTVRSVDLSLLGGSLELEGFRIANPKGYPEGSMLEFARAEIALDTGSLLRDTVEIHAIVIEAPRLYLVGLGRDTNLSTAIKNAEKVAAVGGAGGEEGGDTGEAKKFRIGIVKITDAVLSYQMGSAPAVKVSLGDIVIEDFSNEPGGAADLSAVLGRILRAIASSAVESEVDLPGVFGDSLESDLGGGKAALEKAVKITGEAIKSGEEAVKKIGKFFKDIGGSDQEGKSAEDAAE